MSGNLKDSFYTRSTPALQFAIKGRIIVEPGEKQFNNLQMGCLVVNAIIPTTSRSKRQIMGLPAFSPFASEEILLSLVTSTFC